MPHATSPPDTAAIDDWESTPSPDPPNRRTMASDRETQEFISPVPCTWDVPLSKEKIEKLKLGCRPRDMDDKWFVFASEEWNGTVRVHYFRSWTGKKCYELVVEVGDDGDGRVKELVFETRLGDEKEAKEMVFGVSRSVLEVYFGEGV
ncbi:uncharacterized protein LY89DRAFT_686875 [Mollisia scopiformis]|uniref:Uncharacterized protein n=1 Tax=Mollisia scopiformis TaxID=149040 RepID=A0A194X2H8_MOLSC|nr:uncharacterized protein LY89DRAFT_686875 [Mollisia scopiformis]KUJ14400.1 hypothetical protein LY89DRAFT_686875 [Mollisia scopiformis]